MIFSVCVRVCGLGKLHVCFEYIYTYVSMCIYVSDRDRECLRERCASIVEMNCDCLIVYTMHMHHEKIVGVCLCTRMYLYVYIKNKYIYIYI